MEKTMFLDTQIATGGAQKLLLQQCNCFYDNGYAILAVFLYTKEDLVNNWRKLYPFGIISLNAWSTDRVSFSKVIKLIKGIFRLIYLLITEKIAIIETFTYDSNLIGIPIA